MAEAVPIDFPLPPPNCFLCVIDAAAFLTVDPVAAGALVQPEREQIPSRATPLANLVYPLTIKLFPLSGGQIKRS